jgi:hypothetical protein
MVDRYLDVYEELLAAEPAAAGLPAPADAVPGLSPPPSGAAAWHR